MFQGLKRREVFWYRQTGGEPQLHSIGRVVAYRITGSNVFLLWENRSEDFYLSKEFSVMSMKKDRYGNWSFFSL